MNGPFHLAFATTDLKRIRAFYGKFLGCKEGRSAETWVDYDFFGHQLTDPRGTETDQDRTDLQPQEQRTKQPLGHRAEHWPIGESSATNSRRWA